MTNVSKSLGLVIDLAGAVAWGFGGYVLGSRLISDQAGGLLGLGIFLSILAVMLQDHLHERRMERLIAGRCPRCPANVSYEHRHRRWEASRQEWLAPMTSWECASCGFGHTEAWACPACPAAD